MSKQISLLICGLFLSFISFSQSIHSLSFTNIDGANVSLSSYQNKRIIFLIAPTNVSDSAGFEDIKNFQTQYGTDSIQLIGIMSIEDGYLAANSSALKSRFQNSQINIILTTGMQTKKAAGTNQAGILKWLTNINENGYSNSEARGIGHKFFIDRSGHLTGMLLTDFSFDNSILTQLLSTGN